MFAQQLNNILVNAGTNNKYQFIILFLFMITFIATELFFISLPDLEMQPFVYVTYKDSSIESKYAKLTYDICKQRTEEILDYSIDMEKYPKSSLVIDMGIYCDSMTTSFIAVSLFIGLIIGSCSAYFYADHFGRRNTLLYAYPTYIALLIAFYFIPGNKWIVFPCLFLIGMVSYIINITIMTYICEVILPNKIEIYMTLLVSGTPLGGILYDYLFYELNSIGWRYILLGTSAVCILVYIPIITYMCENPLYYLNNGNLDEFKSHLKQIARKNNLLITNESLDFLSDSTEKNIIINNKTENDYNDKDNEIALIIKNDNNNHKPFWKKTMKSYTPFDLIRYASQITNFFVLCFLWGLGNIILHGLNIYSKQLIFPEETSYHLVFSFVNEIDLLGNVLILLVTIFNKFNPQRLLICLLLLTLSAFFACMLLEQTQSGYSPFSFMIYFNKMCWSCLYTILYIITAKIYPSMLRTKGLGLNRAIGVLCGIGGPYLIQSSLNHKEFVNYYIILTFFGIIFTYVLPDEYEAIYQIPENEKGAEIHLNRKEKRKTASRQSNISNQEHYDNNSRETSNLPFMSLIPEDDANNNSRNSIENNNNNLKIN